MPELPEVETCRRTILPHLLGKVLVSVATSARNYAFLSAPTTLRRNLEGGRVAGIDRHGKYLLIHIADRGRWLVHLGMTGNLLVLPKGETTPRHVHLEAHLEKGQRLVFRDPRKFGKLKWLGDTSDQRIDQLGPDALTVSGEALFAASRKRRVLVKSWLLDQKVLAGVGNIYADEALFRARLRPMRRAEKLTRKECELLAHAIREVLAAAVECGGSTISDFRSADGESGYFQISHQVYGRGGDACLLCATPIVRKVIGQRSSHYCPKCQAR